MSKEWICPVTGCVPRPRDRRYMFIPVTSTANPKFRRELSFLLQEEGYVRTLQDWTANTWKETDEIAMKSGHQDFALVAPCFRTKRGVRVTMLLYDDYTSICVWNAIPGACAYSPGISVRPRPGPGIRRIWRGFDQTVRICRYFSIPSRDLSCETPLEYFDVDGADLCNVIGSNVDACETGITLLTSEYLPLVQKAKNLLTSSS